MSKIKTETRILPAYWASYLINNDSSGISNMQKRQCDEFLAQNQLPMASSCSDSSWYAVRNDAINIRGDVMEFTFLINPPVAEAKGVAA